MADTGKLRNGIHGCIVGARPRDRWTAAEPYLGECCKFDFSESEVEREVTREEQIIGTFVGFAGAMLEDFDIVEFLHRLLERAVELLSCAEAGLLLANAEGALRVMASSSQRSEALEFLQAEGGGGPCVESYLGSRTVLSEDLQEDRERWPAFVEMALENGICSVHSIPMRVQGETIGAFTLFRSKVGRIAPNDLPLGQGLADIAAVAILQERATRERRGVVQQLEHALGSRVLIEQAKGILAERAHASMDAAFLGIRAYSRSHNRRLIEVAGDIVEHRLEGSEIDKLVPPPAR